MSLDVSERSLKNSDVFQSSGQRDDDNQSSKPILQSSLSGDDLQSSKESLVSIDQSSVSNSTYTKQTTVSSMSGSTPTTRRKKTGGRSRIRRAGSSKNFRSNKSNALPPLDFGSAGLVGRDKEISTLKSCYERLMSVGKRELILVGGQSGSGKSSVVRSLDSLMPVEGLFVEGKFNMNTSHEPYSGVAKAFGVICNKVKEAGPETISDLQQELTKELGDEPGLLLQMIPELEGILVVEASDAVVGLVDRVDETEGGVDRLRFAFRRESSALSSLP